MNYGDHNYGKLQVAPVELVVSSQSSCAVRLARHSENAWAWHVERVESCRVESRRAKWNLSYSLCNCQFMAFIGKGIHYLHIALQAAYRSWSGAYVSQREPAYSL